jgi:hypothetical protein
MHQQYHSTTQQCLVFSAQWCSNIYEYKLYCILQFINYCIMTSLFTYNNNNNRLCEMRVSGFGGLWYSSSWVQTRPKSSDFSCQKILSTPSIRGEVKPSVPCRRFVACKRSLPYNGVEVAIVGKITGHFLPTVPPFAARISHVIVDVEAPGGESGNI